MNSTPSDAGTSNSHAHDDEPPPFLRTWKRVYVSVLLYLLLLILALYILTRLA